MPAADSGTARLLQNQHVVNGHDDFRRHYGTNGRLTDFGGDSENGLMNGEQLSSLSIGDLNMTSSQLVDSCLVIDTRRIQSETSRDTERVVTTERRVLHDRGVDMAPYHGEPEVQEISSSYTVDVTYQPEITTNGTEYVERVSPQSSSGLPARELVSRTQKQHTTQQVTKVTKVIREVHHIPIGPDGQPLEPMPSSAAAAAYGASPSPHPGYGPGDYPGYPVPPMDPYRTHSPVSDAGSRRNYEQYGAGYRDYEPYPQSPSYGNYADPRHYADSRSGYAPERPPTPPTPSERSESPPPHRHSPREYAMRGAAGFPQSGYAELDATLMPPGTAAAAGNHFRGPSASGLPDDRFGVEGNGHYGTRSYPGGLPESRNSNLHAPRAVFDEDDPLGHRSPSQASDHSKVRWRDPDLHEVIEFLNHPNNMVKANACAYLQHLCYMDNPVKQKTRALGGIPPLVQLLGHESPDVHKNACGALRNLSYGRQNDENKKCIMAAGGVGMLVRLLLKTPDNEVRELVAGTLWNLSSCEELKRPIIDDALAVLVNQIVIPCSGWDARGTGPAAPSFPDLYLSTVFRNATGVLRNVSSAGEYARKKLRECDGLIDSLLYIVKSAIGKANIDNKSVENCVCVLRNLSYRCQEVEDPNYDKVPPPATSTSSGPTRANASKATDESAGCFGGNKKKKDGFGGTMQRDASGPIQRQRNENVRGMELLWQPEVVQPYLSLLSDCSNAETLEASAGAIQNLSACYWQPSLDVRAAVRKEKGLPILVELLRMEVDRVVCAVATALRNLAIDERNKELIGKYAMRDLVQKLPSGNPQQDQGTSDDTIAAVLATLNEVIKKNADFARSLYECGGVDRLANITRQRQKYNARVIKFASQVLYTMWQHQELREVYKSGKWKESDFVTRTIAAQKAAASTRPGSPNSVAAGGAVGANSTLNRPMASQGGTRYEDRTIQRQPQVNSSGYSMELRDMSYPDGAQMLIHPHAGRAFPSGASPGMAKPGEPLYAQVNREKKKNRQFDASGAPPGSYIAGPGGHQLAPHPYDGSGPGPGDSILMDGRGAPQEPAGDSWV